MFENLRGFMLLHPCEIVITAVILLLFGEELYAAFVAPNSRLLTE